MTENSKLPTGEEVVKKHADLIADPAITATAREYFSTHMDELSDKALYWSGVYVHLSTEYEKKRAKLQLQYERDAMATSPAKDKAKAETAEDAGVVASARYISNFYGRLLRRLEQRKWD